MGDAAFSITLSSKISASRCMPSAKGEDSTGGCVHSRMQHNMTLPQQSMHLFFGYRSMVGNAMLSCHMQTALKCHFSSVVSTQTSISIVCRRYEPKVSKKCLVRFRTKKK